MSYKDRGHEPKPIFSGLGALEEKVGIWAYPLVRLTVGGFLLAHGIPKVMAGATVVAGGGISRIGMWPPVFWAYVLIIAETVGAVCIILGLYTRLVAALLVVEFFIIVFWAHWPRGFTHTNIGWEYPAFWGLIILAILLRGGGPYSLDRKLGKEI